MTTSSSSSSGSSRSSSRSRGQATNDVSIAQATAADLDKTIIHGHALLGALLLPPGGIPMEQTQALLGLAVARHLVLELAALLGEGAGAVVDPLVTVDLLALATSGSNQGVAASARSNGVVLRVAGQNEGILAVGGMSDDIVDARL